MIRLLAIGLNKMKLGVRSLLSRPFNILTFELPVPVIPLEYIWLIVKLKLSVRIYGSRILKFL